MGNKILDCCDHTSLRHNYQILTTLTHTHTHTHALTHSHTHWNTHPNTFTHGSGIHWVPILSSHFHLEVTNGPKNQFCQIRKLFCFSRLCLQFTLIRLNIDNCPTLCFQRVNASIKSSTRATGKRNKQLNIVIWDENNKNWRSWVRILSYLIFYCRIRT
jgi:hypothetical protein